MTPSAELRKYDDARALPAPPIALWAFFLMLGAAAFVALSRLG